MAKRSALAIDVEGMVKDEFGRYINKVAEEDIALDEVYNIGDIFRVIFRGIAKVAVPASDYISSYRALRGGQHNDGHSADLDDWLERYYADRSGSYTPKKKSLVERFLTG